MTGISSTDVPLAPQEQPPPAAGDCAVPAAFRRIVVPVDGSPFAERALPVAAWAAAALGAPIHLLAVVPTGAAPEPAIHYLDELAHRFGAVSWDVARGDDPGVAIVAAARLDEPGLACLATHGRDRSAAALGSVAMEVLDRAVDPVILVGPQTRPPCADDAPVVAAVDGSACDKDVVAVGVEWAACLDRPLVIATVAEPVPGSFRDGRPMRRARGPEDPEAYVAQLAIDVAGHGTTVATRVVDDPVSVRNGMLRLVDRTAGLLVLGTHRRTRPMRALLGSHTARIVHALEIPALVVPLDPTL